MFDFEKISASKFYSALPVERVVEFSPPNIDMSNVARVLSLGVDAKCIDVVTMDGVAEVSGRTNFKMIYLDKDQNARGVDYNADFSVKVEGEFSEGDNARCAISVIEADATSGDSLTLSAVLEVKVSSIIREEFEVLKDACDCYKTHKEVFIPKLLAVKSAVVPFGDEYTVGGEVTNVLGLCSNAIVKDARVMDNVVLTKSLLEATLTYVENNEIKEKRFMIALEDEFDIDDVNEGDTVKLVANIKNAKIVLQGVTDDNVICLEGEVQYNLLVFRCEKVSILNDMFMLTNEVEIIRDKARYTCFDGCGYFLERVSGSAHLADTKAPLIDVVALPYARCYTTRANRIDDNTIEVEGVVNTDVIYTDENGYNSLRAEIPFSIRVDSEIPFSKEVSVECDVQNISATVKRDREMEITFSLAVETCGFSPLEFDYISSVEIGEEKPQNTSGLSIYIASDGDDMLAVCKALTAMPDDILEQNEDMQLPLKEGDRIIYFRKLQAN